MNGANVNCYTYDDDNDGTRSAYASIPYNMLNISYSNRTTQSGIAYSAEIKNNLNEDLTLRVCFEVDLLAPGLDYTPNGGTKLFTTRNYEKNKEYVYISTFVGKRSSKTIEVVPSVSSISDISCEVSGSNSGVVGNSVSFTVTVKTTKAVSQNFRVSLYDANEKVIGQGLNLSELDYKELAGLGDNSQQSVTLTWTLQKAGYTTLKFVVDAKYEIAESN
ncbi:MAG: CARDB domain-containing protein [Halobacteria archaeon]